MQALPADLLRAVLSLLDTRDVARAACACRALRAASEQVPVDVAPTRRRDDVAKFAERRASLVRSFVARRADATALWPAFANLRSLRLTRGLEWGFVAELPPSLEALECVVGGAAHGVLHTSSLDCLPRLRVASVRVCARGDVDLVVLDSTAEELEELAVLRAPTVLVGEAPRARRFRVDCQLLLPRGQRLRDCEALRVSCPLLAPSGLDAVLPRACADLSVRSGVTYVMPATLPAGVTRLAFWGSSIVLDAEALRRAADTLRVLEARARFTIGATAPLALLLSGVEVHATLGGAPVTLW